MVQENDKIKIKKSNDTMIIEKNILSGSLFEVSGHDETGYIRELALCRKTVDDQGNEGWGNPAPIIHVPDDLIIETNPCTWYFCGGRWWYICG
jgi:hypothetical protein